MSEYQDYPSLHTNRYDVATLATTPWGTFASSTPTFRLLNPLHQRYRSLYEPQGVKALRERIVQRKEAFPSSMP